MRADHPYPNPPRLPEGEQVALPELLAGAGPIEIEIGPGRGDFIFQRCAAEPEVRMLGIEIKRKWSSRVDERLSKAGLDGRARVVCEDARHALPRLQPDGSVTRIFIHFPDPWWKKRHQKRMVIVDPLLDQLARLLRDGGELFIQTDVPERADAYQQRVSSHAAFESAGDEPESPTMVGNPYEARGNRERRADEDGLPVYRMRWRRRPR